jgi:hypothetical protein
MNLSEYISDLLYGNDCVIIPGFGGFVGNYAPAKIHPVNHTFYPPSKSILFNSKLTGDDGLLLHSVSIGENISYPETKAQTEKIIRLWVADLESGKTIILEKIGKIRKDNEGRYLFDADPAVNYLESSFGLPNIVSLPVNRMSAQKRLEKKFTDRTLRFRKDHRARRVVSYILIVCLIGLIGWFALTLVPVDKNNRQSAMMIMSEPERKYKDEKAEVIKTPAKPLKDLDFVNPGSDSARQPDKSMPVSENKEMVKARTFYYVIGGAFKSRENADRFLKRLIDAGYHAREAGLNPAGLMMISYFDSEDRMEAVANLDLIRQNENPSAWLLRK